MTNNKVEIPVMVKRDILNALQQEAAKTGIPVSELCSTFLSDAVCVAKKAKPRKKAQHKS